MRKMKEEVYLGMSGDTRFTQATPVIFWIRTMQIAMLQEKVSSTLFFKSVFRNSTVKPVNSNPAKWGQPVKKGHLIWSQTAILSANCTVKWGHLWIRDTFGLSNVVLISQVSLYYAYQDLILLVQTLRKLQITCKYTNTRTVTWSNTKHTYFI
jgi:hypothetical protein